MLRGRLAPRLPHHRLPAHRAVLAPALQGTASAEARGQKGRTAQWRGAGERRHRLHRQGPPGKGPCRVQRQQGSWCSQVQTYQVGKSKALLNQRSSTIFLLVALTGIGASLFALLTANSSPVAGTAGATATESWNESASACPEPPRPVAALCRDGMLAGRYQWRSASVSS